MVFDLRDILNDATADAPPYHNTVDDIVAAGRSLHRRRRQYIWMSGGVAAVAAVAIAGAVSLAHAGGTTGEPTAGPAGDQASVAASATLATGAADATRPTFPTLPAPFMYSIKGYTLGPLHVSNPVLATATYQESIVTLDGVRKSTVMNSTGTWTRSYDSPVGTLTVFRPGVFKPDKFQSGTKVTVRGLPGLLAQFDDTAIDEGAKPTGDANGRMIPPPTHPIKVPALAWQYADGAWATLVTTPEFKTPDPAKDVLSLANGLTPDDPTSVRVPYRLPNVPAGYHLVAIGRFDPMSMGNNISEAYFSTADLPVTGLTGRLTADDLLAAKSGSLKILITETAPAAPTDPDPHPNPNSPCQTRFCDRAINDAYFAEVEGGRTDIVRSVTNGLVFDNPADPATWHDVTTFTTPK
jgi:hypothetical protein